MVTGRRAFAGGSSAETLAAVLKEQPKPPSELLPDVPRDLERIILRCLRKERERRFQHMPDVKVELQEVEGGVRLAGRDAARRGIAQGAGPRRGFVRSLPASSSWPRPRR